MVNNVSSNLVSNNNSNLTEEKKHKSRKKSIYDFGVPDRIENNNAPFLDAASITIDQGTSNLSKIAVEKLIKDAQQEVIYSASMQYVQSPSLSQNGQQEVEDQKDFKKMITQWIIEIEEEGKQTHLNEENFNFVCSCYPLKEWNELCEYYLSLYVINLIEIGSEDLNRVIKSLEKIKLECLILGECKITPLQLELFTILPLKDLSLIQCQQLDLSALDSILKFKELDTLVLESCDWVNDDVVRTLSKTKINILSLHRCNGTGLTSETLMTLTGMSLMGLDLGYCKWVDGAATRKAHWSTVSNYPLKALQTLSLKGTNIVDQDLREMPFSLTLLDISDCNQLTIETFKHLKNSSLEQLYVNHTVWFGEFVANGHDFQKLTKIEANGCPNLINIDLFYLAQLKNLQKLSANDCSKLTERALISLQQAQKLELFNELDWKLVKKLIPSIKGDSMALDTYLEKQFKNNK